MNKIYGCLMLAAAVVLLSWPAAIVAEEKPSWSKKMDKAEKEAQTLARNDESRSSARRRTPEKKPPPRKPQKKQRSQKSQKSKKSKNRSQQSKPVVLQFNNIPAESFVNTLKQLARNDKVAKAFKDMPIAVNGPANAVVVIVPPDAAESLMVLAKQLDKPNQFHEKMKQKKIMDEQIKLKMECARRKMEMMTSPDSKRSHGKMGGHGMMSGGMKCGPDGKCSPGMSGGMGKHHMSKGKGSSDGRHMSKGKAMGGMQDMMKGDGPLKSRSDFMKKIMEKMRQRHHSGKRGPMDGHDGKGRPESEHKGGPKMMHQGGHEMMNHGKSMMVPMIGLKLLMAPGAAEKLDMTDKQGEQLKGVLVDTLKHAQKSLKQITSKINDTPPEQLGEAFRKIQEKKKDMHAEFAKKVTGKIMKILTPEQKKKIMGEFSKRFSQGKSKVSGNAPDKDKPSWRHHGKRKQYKK